jgi:hypothetical protein
MSYKNPGGLKPTPLFPEIAEELRYMIEDDGEERLKDKPDLRKWDDEDLRHTLRLREIIAEVGWPTISKVGAESSNHAWRLAQHADLDTDFQEFCLGLMVAQASGEVNKEDIAHLTDRILVAKKLPQQYGTQFYQIFKAANIIHKCLLRDVEDPENLEKRRLDLGIKPFVEHLRIFAKTRGFVLEEIDLGNFAQYFRK